MAMEEENKIPEPPAGNAQAAAEQKPAAAERSPIPERDPVTGKRDRRDPKDLNAFENFYENFRNVPVRYVDRFIALCVIAMAVVILLGILNR